jgi:hypothetical protein
VTTPTTAAKIRCQKCKVVLMEVVDTMFVAKLQDRHILHIPASVLIGPFWALCRRCDTQTPIGPT